jgi:hypothetical protein
LMLWGLILAAVAAGSPAWSQPAPQWIETWAASPQQPIDPMVGSAQTPLTLNGQTIRQIVRISVGGDWFLLRLTNEFTEAPIVVGEVHVAVSAATGAPSSAIVPGTDRAVRRQHLCREQHPARDRTHPRHADRLHPG